MGRKSCSWVLTAVVLVAGLLARSGPLLGRADAPAHHAPLPPDLGPAGPPGTLAAVPVPPSAQEPSSQAKVLEVYGKLPLHFEANQGQTDKRVKFLARGRGYTLFLTATEAVLALRPGGKAEGGEQKAAISLRNAEFGMRNDQPEGPETRAKARKSTSEIPQSAIRNPHSTVVRMRLVGANPTPEVGGLEELRGKLNYFLGNDPTKWRTNIPTYAKVKYQGVYPGVDLVYYGNQRQLEYDLVVAPGADIKAIQLAFEGADKLKIDTQGDLLLKIAGGEIRLHKPRIYQEANGTKVPIPGAYVLEKSGQLSASSAQRSTFRKPHSAFRNQVVGFQVAAYDLARPLIIDPVLSYSTLLGGSDAEYGNAIAVDAHGYAYVTGYTASVDFPTFPWVRQPNYGGSQDVFVTKLDPTGSGLVYSTYLGGSGEDRGYGIAVDALGYAYVTGYTLSLDFPTTPGAFEPVPPGAGDVFVTKLNPAGSALVYSTYLGGTGGDVGYGIAVDADGQIFVTGDTDSVDFPTTFGAFQRTRPGTTSPFVVRLRATDYSLVYSTYLGGKRSDGVYGIAVDTWHSAYVTGWTAGNFPTSPGPFQPPPCDFGGIFVAKLDPIGSALLYSGCLGEGRTESPRGIAVDRAGNAYVAGNTTGRLPTTPGAFQPTFRGGVDAFVMKLDSTGSSLVYSTYLGGSTSDLSWGIAVDIASGNAHVTGETISADFPTTPDAFQPRCSGTTDAFVTILNPTGSGLVYSTCLGGAGGDYGRGIAVDTSGNTYVTGDTTAVGGFPTTPGAFQRTPRGYNDAFVAKFGPPVSAPQILSVSKSGTGSGTVTSNPPGIDCGTTCSASFEYGTSVTLTASPSPGSAFTRWEGDCTGPTPTCTVEMTVARSVTAVFSAVDTIPPDTAITGGPSGPIAANTANFTWTGSDDRTPVANLVYAFRLHPLEPAFSPFGAATAKNYLALAPGPYTFFVKAKDEAGNEDPTPASRSFRVDTAPPDTTILSGPSGPIAATSATFTWTGADDQTPVANLVYAFRLHPLEPAFGPFGAATGKTYMALTPGPYTFYVKAKDEAGNEDPTPASRSFSVVDAPRLTLSLNQPSFRPRETMILSATVTPGVTPRSVDGYVAIAIPGGTLLFLLGDGSFTAEVRPILTGWAVAAFSGEIFRYTFSGGEPPGAYTWLAAFTQPGTLTLIGPIVSAPFTFSP